MTLRDARRGLGLALTALTVISTTATALSPTSAPPAATAHTARPDATTQATPTHQRPAERTTGATAERTAAHPADRKPDPKDGRKAGPKARHATGQRPDTAVYVRMYPGRKDDVAWENESAIYRAYGPALQRSGERAYGYDVWCKNTPQLCADLRYRMDSLGLVERHRLPGGAWGNPAADSIEHLTSFHYDHGNGLDCYTVGPTLGCGTPALVIDGAPVLPWCYRQYTLLKQTPDLVRFRLDYDTVDIGGDRVVERRTITARRGTRYCECEVTYEGLTRPAQVCAGIAHHGQDDSIRCDLGRHYLAYVDPTDRPGDPAIGRIYIGLYVPTMTEMRITKAGILAIAPYKPGETFRYWFGTGWSLGDCPAYDVLLGELARPKKYVTVR